ncbi:bifunctional folylpolyglutamate synthase/dihydrofolate synthase [Bacillus solimangrovi]|uniref:Dihydrofolate synthase/folylpolyglutamate synthase n=1 Tax=Bacillus solimangrovi TaxID=1305675 RepID=A0A1E5LBK0_9BACI|nr:folylpolyglutamate synthase/dihydrofolate synthase family protein [Bacillus solimangrovi]OEH91444.1 bifunctional folylpolyglutamate synthase/dihydrofolate synthase [Bacillus solimangrovi]
MFTTVDEAINWLHSRERFGIKPGLKRMKEMLEQLGNPERRLKMIHIAGTNGKGSVVSYLRHMFQEAGHETATFTSPYIESFNERISVNGTPISDEHLLKVVNDVKPIVDNLDDNQEIGKPTEFEILTVISIQYFARIAYPDIVLFETGLGGRLDSTNVIHPMLSIITNIGYDHMDILGETIEEIASEKAGIIKSGVPVIAAVAQQEALAVIEAKVNEQQTKLYQLGREFQIIESDNVKNGETFTFQSPFVTLENIEISMKGPHQVRNASLALMAVDYMKRFYSLIVDEQDIRTGLKKTSWPGRFEVVKEKPLTILDGAHNPEGIQALKNTVERHYKEHNVHIIFAAMKDKKLSEMVSLLDSFADTISFVDFDFPRAAASTDLIELSKVKEKQAFAHWSEAYQEVVARIGTEDVVLVTGSLYFISDVRKELYRT